jgi:hypothetical protein
VAYPHEGGQTREKRQCRHEPHSTRAHRFSPPLPFMALTARGTRSAVAVRG